jgi:COMPASS component SWD1
MPLVGAADPATHKIYIWDISNDGQFATALDGGREPLIDVHVRSSILLASYPHFLFQWHPSGPRLASTTNQGTILIWHSPSPERWGAFAGGFEEADENAWYEEGESEFDLASFLEIYSMAIFLTLPCETGR